MWSEPGEASDGVVPEGSVGVGGVTVVTGVPDCPGGVAGMTPILLAPVRSGVSAMPEVCMAGGIGGAESAVLERRREAIVLLRLVLKSPPSSLFLPKRPLRELLALVALPGSRSGLTLTLRSCCLEDDVEEKTSLNLVTTGSALSSLRDELPLEGGSVAACLGDGVGSGGWSDVADDESEELAGKVLVCMGPAPIADMGGLAARSSSFPSSLAAVLCMRGEERVR